MACGGTHLGGIAPAAAATVEDTCPPPHEALSRHLAHVSRNPEAYVHRWPPIEYYGRNGLFIRSIMRDPFLNRLHTEAFVVEAIYRNMFRNGTFRNDRQALR